MAWDEIQSIYNLIVLVFDLHGDVYTCWKKLFQYNIDMVFVRTVWQDHQAEVKYDIPSETVVLSNSLQINTETGPGN